MTQVKWLALIVVANFLLIIPMAAVPAMAQYSYDNKSNTGTGTAIGGTPGLLPSNGLGTPLGGVGIGSGMGTQLPGSQTDTNNPTSSYPGDDLGLPSSGTGGVPAGSGLGMPTGGLPGY